MTDNPMLEPAYWRMRAEETRAKAEGLMISEHQREKLLKKASQGGSGV
ncbi:hypothetical protein JQ615_38920 [Bradyrhizobium jicamae]|uniref:Uncharacterized protein n=1 Tax=Bradyrhizobium jicamae TaxID=280332 RepID=A0ABS5FWV0_9BRAD|nr:hypothetical protein [Bradyrhizobium jicamae]MBR0801337.1 hypothetical protein [Bradyrhizobium jicamae]